MLTCPKCGSNNPLGQVFCRACGSRLDYRGTSASEIAGTMRASIWRRIPWVWGVVAAVAIVLLLVGLACWPKSVPLGEEGTRVGAERVKNQFSAVSKIRRRQRLGISFTEKDLNGYFRFVKVPALNLDSLSVEVNERRARVRMVQTLTVVDIGPIRFSPQISRDVVIVPAGNRLIFRKASMGHLAFMGPFKGIVIRAVRRRLGGETEWKALEDAAEVTMERGKVSVLVEK